MIAITPELTQQADISMMQVQNTLCEDHPNSSACLVIPVSASMQRAIALFLSRDRSLH
jgi:hypothetical protein